ALLLTGDLRLAVEAVLASDPAAAVHQRVARERGILAVLQLLPPDARLRIASLVGFAATVSLPEAA
ncbi:MAG: hypothetical protein KC656_03915, partial [Myxococcales bacterium]|nr:hypothetical protein [Myxococcales bacterium]